MSEIACERGGSNVTVARVVDRAGVSRRTFYELFADCEDCLLATLEHALACAEERVLAADRSAGCWSEQVRAALDGLLGFLDDEPLLGRLLLVESLAAGPRALERRATVVSRLVDALERGRREAKAGERVTPLASEAAIGGVLTVIGARLIQGGPEPLFSLLNPLVAIVILPYLGAAAARKELSRKAPARRCEGTARETLDPLRETGMRLTYRTMRVLVAVSEHPGASNRAIANVAGIRDQGQMSKLLMRLKSLGLIENATIGASRGHPNSWKLTHRGRRMQGVIGPQSGVSL